MATGHCGRAVADAGEGVEIARRPIEQRNPAMNRRVLALILLCGALALPALPVHADATDDLFEAVKNGTASEVKAALAAGADPGARARAGMTPLHFAAAKKNPNPSVTKALIEAGADPGARNERGMTPFDYVKDNEALKGTGVYRLLNPAAGAGAAAWAPAWAVRGPWARDRPGPCAKKRGASAWRRSPACMASSWRRSSASRCWSRMPARSLLAWTMARTPCHMPTAATEAAMAETTEAAALMTAGSIMAGAVRSS